MPFQPIDLTYYPRRQHYEHFQAMQLTYSATVQIDITALRNAAKRHGFRAYLAQIWLLTTAANRIPEFRMSLDECGQLGIWDHVDPLYTVLNDTTQTFSGIWTTYSGEFPAFHQNCVDDIARYNDGTLEPKTPVPANILNISSLPWLDFTAFNLNLPTTYLLPILTLGRYIEHKGKTLAPLAIQVHHAVCDGLHLGRFVEEVRKIAEDAPAWLTPNRQVHLSNSSWPRH